MEKNETKKNIRRFYAGDVIQIELNGKKRPCDIAMALLTTPFVLTDGQYTGSIATAWGLDTDKNKMLPGGCFTDGPITVEKVTGKKKAWFFRTVNELYRKSAEEHREMEVLVAYDDEDGSHHNIATMSDKDWKTGCKEQRMKAFLLNHYSAWLDSCTDDDRKEYEDEIGEAATRLSVGLSATCCGDDLYFETVTLI